MPDAPQFLFVTCQLGAERAVKQEVAREWPAFRFAYSRPGFLTFKLPAGERVAEDLNLRSVFARACGFSLGKTTAVDLADRAANALKVAAGRQYKQLHVWQRDPLEMGHHGFEPGMTEEVREAEGALRHAMESQAAAPLTLPAPRGGGVETRTSPLHRGDLVLDCILVEPTEWWIGYHVVTTVQSRWPGGIFTIEPPADMVSRAYIKMREALAWSRLPVKRNDVVAEIGSAPGGSSQALLEKGLKVIGIDPAEMDERVLANPRFTHIRKRGHEVRRRQFRGVRWLTADINVAPAYTLETVEKIVTHEAVDVEGLLLTLKLLDWKLADEVPDYLVRVKSWGYKHVLARQLSHNRQEICVAAMRERPGTRRK